MSIYMSLRNLFRSIKDLDRSVARAIMMDFGNRYAEWSDLTYDVGLIVDTIFKMDDLGEEPKGNWPFD